MTENPDQTDTEALERQRRRLASLGLLTGYMTHDVNNLLQPIISFSRLARERIDALPTGPDGLALDGLDDVRGDLDLVFESARQAADLIARLQAVARADAAGPREVVFAHEVSRALALVERGLPAPIEIRAHLAEDPGRVAAHPAEVFSLLDTLVANAAQVLEGRGVIDVTLHRECLSAEMADALALAPGDHFRLTVSGAGRGLEPSGTGLDALVVQRLAARWRGAIRVADAPGEGAAFTFYLPIVPSRTGEV